MCGLCGAFGQKMHWSDDVDQHKKSPVNTHVSRIQRMQRISILNTYLNPKKIKIRDWQNVHYILENTTGRIEIAEDIFDIWVKVEHILGYPFDPLELKDGKN